MPCRRPRRTIPRTLPPATPLQCTNDPAALAAARGAPQPPAADPRPRPAKWAPGTLKSGLRQAGAAAPVCACADAGFNTPACFKGVTEYCTAPAEAKPNMALCEAMSGFLNRQNVTAGRVAAQYLVGNCGIKVSPRPSVCPCLEVGGGLLAGGHGQTAVEEGVTGAPWTRLQEPGPRVSRPCALACPLPHQKDATSEGCRAATLDACLKGESLCVALAFGDGADLQSREDFAE
jgi:hypothetical protein